jgi:hypothetical protein
MNRKPFAGGVALVLMITLVPGSGALTDYVGAFDQADFVIDHALVDKFPCNKQGVTWNGVTGNPLLREAIQTVGPEFCDRMTMTSELSFIHSVDVSGGVHEDGALTVRVIFPLVKTPILLPFRDQNAAGGFGANALEEARQALESAVEGAPATPDWIPYVLNPNDPVPCSGRDTDSETVQPPAPWSATTRTCGNVGADAPRHGIGTVAARTDAGAVGLAPPSTIARVDRIFELTIAAVVPLDNEGNVQTVHATTLSNVVLVNNAATETLPDFKRKVEDGIRDAGQQASSADVQFQVTAFLSEAQKAAGNPLKALAGVHGLLPAPTAQLIPLAEEPYFEIVSGLPGEPPAPPEIPTQASTASIGKPSSAWPEALAMLGSGPSAASASGTSSPSGGATACSPGKTTMPFSGKTLVQLTLTIANGCLSTKFQTSWQGWGNEFGPTGAVTYRRQNGEDFVIARAQDDRLFVDEFFRVDDRGGSIYVHVEPNVLVRNPYHDRDIPMAAFPIWTFTGTVFNTCSGGPWTSWGCSSRNGASIAVDARVERTDSFGKPNTGYAEAAPWWESSGGGSVYCLPVWYEKLKELYTEGDPWTIVEFLDEHAKCWADQSADLVKVYKDDVLGSTWDQEADRVQEYMGAYWTAPRVLNGKATPFKISTTFGAHACCSGMTSFGGSANYKIMQSEAIMEGIQLVYVV